MLTDAVPTFETKSKNTRQDRFNFSRVVSGSNPMELHLFVKITFFIPGRFGPILYLVINSAFIDTPGTTSKNLLRYSSSN